MITLFFPLLRLKTLTLSWLPFSHTSCPIIQWISLLLLRKVFGIWPWPPIITSTATALFFGWIIVVASCWSFCVQPYSIQPLLYIFERSYQSGSQVTHSFTQNLPTVLCPTIFHTTSSLHFWVILPKWQSSHTLLYPESSSGSVSNWIPYNLFSTFLGDLTKVEVKPHTPLPRIFQRF